MYQNSMTRFFTEVFFFFYYVICLLAAWSYYIRQKCQPLNPASLVVSFDLQKNSFYRYYCSHFTGNKTGTKRLKKVSYLQANLQSSKEKI